jgi:squalene-hopene/tetraprenyl-beta-curcumene cyclase
MHQLGFLALMTTSFVLSAADWDLSRAAAHLDSRQKQWKEWKPAQAAGGQCVSCHTGIPYALARPVLRRAMGEPQPTEWESGMLAGLNFRLAAREPVTMFSFQREPAKSQAAGVEAVIAAFVLGQSPATSADTRKKVAAAFERLWKHQSKDGEYQGAWPWFHFKLDPWESEQSGYFGAALAAIALGNAPQEISADERYKDNRTALLAYLKKHLSVQPMHNQLMTLWASSRLPGLLTPAEKSAIAETILGAQRADGGWPISALGPWSYTRAGLGDESNAYATAFTTYVLQQIRSACGDTRQDPASGAWLAPTMTKQYPPESMQAGFMNDAATGFAVMVLLNTGCQAQ